MKNDTNQRDNRQNWQNSGGNRRRGDEDSDTGTTNRDTNLGDEQDRERRSSDRKNDEA